MLSHHYTIYAWELVVFWYEWALDLCAEINWQRKGGKCIASGYINSLREKGGRERKKERAIRHALDYNSSREHYSQALQ
jgi:hypothetical protein